MDDHHSWNFSNESFNYTDDFEFSFCETFLAAIVPWNLAVYVSLIVIGAIANVLLLFAMYKDPLKCFRNPTSLFIANLSMADLINSLFNFEEMLVSQTQYKSTFCLPGAWGTIHSAFGIFVYLLPFPAVAVLALERYVSIARPLWHKVEMTSRVCYICIAVVWLINFIYAGISMHFMPELQTGYQSVFFVTTVLIYILAFISIRKRRFPPSTDESKSESVRRMMKLRSKYQKRFLTTVLIINVILIFGIIPTVIGTHFKFTLMKGTISTSAAVLFYITDILFLINTAASPFLYLWRLPRYRKTFFVTYCCKK